jgi:hypothetical protein
MAKTSTAEQDGLGEIAGALHEIAAAFRDIATAYREGSAQQASLQELMIRAFGRVSGEGGGSSGTTGADEHPRDEGGGDG